MALLNKHSKPMAKLFGVQRYWGKDKNWLVVELEQELVAKKWVAFNGDKRLLSSDNIEVARYFRYN